MEPDSHITALQAEIRRAGRLVCCSRWITGGAAAVLLLPLAVWRLEAAFTTIRYVITGYACGPSGSRAYCRPEVVYPSQAFVWSRSVGAVLLIAAVLGWVTALAYRQLKLRQLRFRLATVPPEDRTSALVPLCADRLRDTRKIVKSLIREAGLSTELTPAAAPDAHGNEASSVEPTR
jgi:hypothetical protein